MNRCIVTVLAFGVLSPTIANATSDAGETASFIGFDERGRILVYAGDINKEQHERCEVYLEGRRLRTLSFEECRSALKEYGDPGTRDSLIVPHHHFDTIPANRRVRLEYFRDKTGNHHAWIANVEIPDMAAIHSYQIWQYSGDPEGLGELLTEPCAVLRLHPRKPCDPDYDPACHLGLRTFDFLTARLLRETFSSAELAPLPGRPLEKEAKKIVIRFQADAKSRAEQTKQAFQSLVGQGGGDTPSIRLEKSTNVECGMELQLPEAWVDTLGKVVPALERKKLMTWKEVLLWSGEVKKRTP